VSKRDKSLPERLVDPEYLVRLVRDTWDRGVRENEQNIDNERLYEANWRELNRADNSGPWDGSANFHVPLTLTYVKAIHARLWQLFASPEGFYDVEARAETFRDKEQTVKSFMDWVWSSYSNSNQGTRQEMDAWLWDVVSRGSGYLKCYWKREERTYSEVQPVVDITEETIISPENPTGVVNAQTTVREEEVEVTEVLQTPQIRRILREDVVMPVGYSDPQDAPYFVNRVYMSDDDLKSKANTGQFYRSAVEASIESRRSQYTMADSRSQQKNERNISDGTTADPFMDTTHVILEYYGPAFIMKEVNVDEADDDLSETKREIIAWIHETSNELLGWTYLNRVSPSGIRPVFKADYMLFPERSSGVGVAELTYDMNRHTDALFNLRFDNGTLASIPMFAYRNTSNSLKPVQVRMKPGGGIPVDDVNDIKQFSFPYLANFGNQEEQALTGYAERLLATSDIQLGRAPAKVGALRNATGSNLLQSESGIQLEIHFDRIARCMSRLLQFLFVLCRERMPAKLYYRVTGERGEPIFGRVNRDDLRGDFDFSIKVDILSQSQTEKQQLAVLMMQTLINPAGMQTGVVQPANIYALYKNFLKVNRVARIDDYLTPPPDYTGPKVSPNERVLRIITGNIDGLEDTVQLAEDHEKAIKFYESFKGSDDYGLLTQGSQIAALERLIQKHQELLQAQMAGGSLNQTTGMQVPRQGFTPDNMNSLAPPAVGVPNGPVV
jgi:hypothetical protein